jgi:hypothetical protein
LKVWTIILEVQDKGLGKTHLTEAEIKELLCLDLPEYIKVTYSIIHEELKRPND